MSSHAVLLRKAGRSENPAADSRPPAGPAGGQEVRFTLKELVPEQAKFLRRCAPYGRTVGARVAQRRAVDRRLGVGRQIEKAVRADAKLGLVFTMKRRFLCHRAFDGDDRDDQLRPGGDRGRDSDRRRSRRHHRTREEHRSVVPSDGDYGFIERDPIFRPLANDAGVVRVLDRMRRDVETQRKRARTRGLLELKSLIGR